MEKLPCGHDDDFAHALTVVFGLYLRTDPTMWFNGNWQLRQTQMIGDIRELFKMAGAVQPSTEALGAVSYKVKGNETSH